MNQRAWRYRAISIAIMIVAVAVFVPAAIFAQDSIPVIPHPLEGRDACLACHETGIAGAPTVPDDHAGRTNAMCQACHQPATPTEEAATPQSPTPTTTRETITPRSPTPTTTSGTATPQSPTPTTTSEAVTSPSPTPATTVTTSGEGIPQAVPHTLVGREDCLRCHISSETTLVPAGGPPDIPHSLQGRDNCLACHEQGVGGAPQIPSDHAGRPNDVCQSCHQPGEAPTMATPSTVVVGLVPTPLVFPKAEGVNTCIDCHAKLGGTHAEITAQWERSIHARRNVSCADCHGGNPAAQTADEAMSPVAGYIGVPAKTVIPALCASCHSDVAMMRPYDLPTDQYAKYQESIHGIRLAEGDTNVTTCFDCHGGHEILEPNDPKSTVYPANVPQLCAGCHSDKELMAPYHIPTNQYALYKDSVHGHALLVDQDFRAPNCATCHGTHGAAPPGFEEVANVCGSCHGATQEYYLKSVHAQLGDQGPRCVTCHGRYDVSVPTDDLFLGMEPRHCGSCHPPDSAGGQAAQSTYDAITQADIAYSEAEKSVTAASDLGMVVADEKNLLTAANTDLVTARAAQHSGNLKELTQLTGQAQSTSEQVKASADAKIEASVFRRRVMIIAVAAIAVTVGALYLLKRELHKHLDSESEP